MERADPVLWAKVLDEANEHRGALVEQARRGRGKRKKERPTPVTRRALRGHSSMRTTEGHGERVNP